MKNNSNNTNSIEHCSTVIIHSDVVDKTKSRMPVDETFELAEFLKCLEIQQGLGL